jgi:hypothetical protein
VGSKGGEEPLPESKMKDRESGKIKEEHVEEREEPRRRPPRAALTREIGNTTIAFLALKCLALFSFALAQQ